jgi:hypothetical protein
VWKAKLTQEEKCQKLINNIYNRNMMEAITVNTWGQRNMDFCHDLTVTIVGHLVENNTVTLHAHPAEGST